MSCIKKHKLLVSLLGLLLMPLSPAEAGMVSTGDIIQLQQDRIHLTEVLAREDVQQQLIELGVDPASAKARIDQMTDEEVAQLNGRIAELPAGAGLSTTQILLIIIIILLVI